MARKKPLLKRKVTVDTEGFLMAWQEFRLKLRDLKKELRRRTNTDSRWKF